MRRCQMMQKRLWKQIELLSISYSGHYVGGSRTMALTRAPEHLDLPNPFRIQDDIFLRCFKFNKVQAEQLMLDMCDRLSYDPLLSHYAIPFDIMLLSTFSYLTHGNLSYLLGHHYAFKLYSRVALNSSVPDMCFKITTFLAPLYIRFPTTANQIEERKYGFLGRRSFPGVIGVLDTFTVVVGKVPLSEKIYYENEKGQLCLQVQVICDERMRFMDVDPTHAGDSSVIGKIWHTSNIKYVMRQLQAMESCILIASERDYPYEQFLLTYRFSPQKTAFKLMLQETCVVMKRALMLLKFHFK